MSSIVACRFVLAAGLIVALSSPLLAQDGDQAPGNDPATEEGMPGDQLAHVQTSKLMVLGPLTLVPGPSLVRGPRCANK